MKNNKKKNNKKTIIGMIVALIVFILFIISVNYFDEDEIRFRQKRNFCQINGGNYLEDIGYCHFLNENETIDEPVPFDYSIREKGEGFCFDKSDRCCNISHERMLKERGVLCEDLE